MDNSDVRGITLDFVKAYNSGDLKTLLSLYEEDAKVLPPNMPAFMGKAAIGDFWKVAMSTGMRARLEPAELLMDENVACERGAIFLTTGHGTPAEKVSRGKYLTVMRRRADGAWKLVFDIWNSDRS